MSNCTVDVAIERIKTATSESPIAVFFSDMKYHVNVVFASTVATRDKIARKDPSLIGVYTGNMDMTKVKADIKRKALLPA